MKVVIKTAECPKEQCHIVQEIPEIIHDPPLPGGAINQPDLPIRLFSSILR